MIVSPPVGVPGVAQAVATAVVVPQVGVIPTLSLNALIALVLLIGLGTAQVVYATFAQMPATVPGLLRGPYPGGRFYRLGADDWGSGTVSWACRTISGLADVKDFDRAVSVAPEDCHGVRFVADISVVDSWADAKP